MGLFLCVFAVMFLVFLAMAIGVLFANKPISGSCGGMKTMGMDVSCEICGGEKSKCENVENENSAFYDKELAESYDASKPGFNNVSGKKKTYF